MNHALRQSSLALTLVVGAMIPPAGAVGFQQVSVPDPDGPPLELAIWYPSGAPAAPRPLELYRQTVAVDGAIAGSQLPLIVISHGTGGSAATHFDTAIALAEAGFVAAAVTHTGDNSRDHSYSFTPRNLGGRPRHLKLAIDYLLTVWTGHEHLAGERIGAFGHSAGGFTVLVAVGGNPDPDRLLTYCRDHPDDWGCQRARAHRDASGDANADPATPLWVHDPRIKAAVIAAPAIGHGFTRAALAAVSTPVQLWQAAEDRVAPNRWSSENVKAGLPVPPETHVVPNAGHFAFIAPCSSALAERVPEICEDPPGFDRAAFHAEFNQAVIAFFQQHLPSAPGGTAAALSGSRK